MIAEEYKCIDAYKKPENPMEWLPCPRCGLRPLVWEFDNGRATACGSGKSTLLNMISKYMLCEKKMCSELPSEALYFPDIFDDDKVLDGISIKSDYIGKVFHLLQQTEMRKDDILDNINNLSLYMNGTSRSSGEKNLHAMNSLF